LTLDEDARKLADRLEKIAAIIRGDEDTATVAVPKSTRARKTRRENDNGPVTKTPEIIQAALPDQEPDEPAPISETAEVEGFSEWFETRVGGALRGSFSAIPDKEILPALHALLIRAGARPESESKKDEEDAERIYRNILASHPESAASVAYRIAICANLRAMREAYRVAKATLKPPGSGEGHEPTE